MQSRINVDAMRCIDVNVTCINAIRALDCRFLKYNPISPPPLHPPRYSRVYRVLFALFFKAEPRVFRHIVRKNEGQFQLAHAHSIISAFVIRQHSIVYICRRFLIRHITKTCLFKYTETFTTIKRKFSDKKFWNFSYFCSKHRLWVLVRTASPRRF